MDKIQNLQSLMPVMVEDPHHDIKYSPHFSIFRAGRKVDEFHGSQVQRLRDRMWLHNDRCLRPEMTTADAKGVAMPAIQTGGQPGRGPWPWTKRFMSWSRRKPKICGKNTLLSLSHILAESIIT